jgi:hypothetical protein
MGATIRADSSSDRTAQLLWGHEHGQWRATKSVEFCIAVGFCYVARSRICSAVSTKSCGKDRVSRFSLVLGLLWTIDRGQPSRPLLHVARNQNIHHFPRLCSACGHALWSCLIDCVYCPLDTFPQAWQGIGNGYSANQLVSEMAILQP